MASSSIAVASSRHIFRSGDFLDRSWNFLREYFAIHRERMSARNACLLSRAQQQ